MCRALLMEPSLPHELALFFVINVLVLHQFYHSLDALSSLCTSNSILIKINFILLVLELQYNNFLYNLSVLIKILYTIFLSFINEMTDDFDRDKINLGLSVRCLISIDASSVADKEKFMLVLENIHVFQTILINATKYTPQHVFYKLLC